MINKSFSETISLLTDKLNRTYYGVDSRAFPFDRIKNSIYFIAEKNSYFSSNLDDLIFELNDMKKDAEKLFKEFNTSPESFQILEYIKRLIECAEVEKIDRKNTSHKTDSKTSSVYTKREKVKIFNSAFLTDAEEDINKFLNENNVEITRVIQSSRDQSVTITIFYKEI